MCVTGTEALSDLATRAQCVELWDEPRVLDKLRKLRKAVIEWYIEYQVGKPCTPSLSLLSFERRQILTRKKKRAELKEISAAVEILAYGCKLLSVDKDLLVSAAFCILTVEPQRPLREVR